MGPIWAFKDITNIFLHFVAREILELCGYLLTKCRNFAKIANKNAGNQKK